MIFLRNSYVKMTKRIKGIHRIALIGAILLGSILVLTACSGQDIEYPVKATWIEPQVNSDTISIPVSEVEENHIVHFNVTDSSGSEMAFMAYEVNGKLHVRANVCPPCRSVGFSLDKNTLVCDTCRTTFDSSTGDGISGACVDYPKAFVSYEVVDGKIVMKGSALLAAYRNTNSPGLP